MRRPDIAEFRPVRVRELTGDEMVADGAVLSNVTLTTAGALLCDGRTIPADAYAFVWVPDTNREPVPYATRRKPDERD